MQPGSQPARQGATHPGHHQSCRTLGHHQDIGASQQPASYTNICKSKNKKIKNEKKNESKTLTDNMKDQKDDAASQPCTETIKK